MSTVAPSPVPLQTVVPGMPAVVSHAWRAGILPVLTVHDLEMLRAALAGDDPALVQGGTVLPPCGFASPDDRCERACALAFIGWRAHGLVTVSEVEELFAHLCAAIDYRMGEPAGCRWFMNWWDSTAREIAFPALLAEVEAALAERSAA